MPFYHENFMFNFVKYARKEVGERAQRSFHGKIVHNKRLIISLAKYAKGGERAI